MDRSKGMQVLDDSELDAVNGGVGGGAPMKMTSMSSMNSNQLSYYLMGLCPNCKKNLTAFGKNFGCSACMTVFIQ